MAKIAIFTCEMLDGSLHEVKASEELAINSIKVLAQEQTGLVAVDVVTMVSTGEVVYLNSGKHHRPGGLRHKKRMDRKSKTDAEDFLREKDAVVAFDFDVY